MKKNNMREVPKKNYIYVLLLTIVTILLLLYSVRWYKLRNSENFENSIISNVITEINFSEIDNFLIENPYIMIYISNSETIENDTFEKEFANYLKEYELKNKIIYIDIAKLSSNDISLLKDKWFNNLEIVSPNILLFENGEMKDQLYFTKEKINLNDVKTFLSGYEVNS